MSVDYKRTLLEHADSLAQKEYSARELTEAYLTQIDRIDGQIGAYLTVTAERALAMAAASDARRAAGASLGLLDGIPFAVKDNICTRATRTTCASRMLADYLPPYDATVIERLCESGAVMLGKTNMDEFAMGSTGEHSAFGLTRNPADTQCMSGGSSSGSAAAVASAQAVFSLGSDTGGSVRLPAAFCGVVGMKPTYGRISRYGLIAHASSLDQIGVLSTNVRDNAAVLAHIVGHDARDATSAQREDRAFLPPDGCSLKGVRIGLIQQLMGEKISGEVRSAVWSAAERFRQLGAVVSEISLPSLENAAAAYYVIACAEASSNLARFDGVRYGHRTESASTLAELYCRSRSEGFGEEVKRRILLGTFVLSEGYAEEYYRRAMRTREAIRQELDSAWSDVDLLLSPSAPTVAYRIGETAKLTERYESDLCCVAANLAGLPAISIPCGKGRSGLPIGMQLMGRAFDEASLYRAACAYEDSTR